MISAPEPPFADWSVQYSMHRTPVSSGTFAYECLILSLHFWRKQERLPASFSKRMMQPSLRRAPRKGQRQERIAMGSSIRAKEPMPEAPLSAHRPGGSLQTSERWTVLQNIASRRMLLRSSLERNSAWRLDQRSLVAECRWRCTLRAFEWGQRSRPICPAATTDGLLGGRTFERTWERVVLLLVQHTARPQGARVRPGSRLIERIPAWKKRYRRVYRDREHAPGGQKRSGRLLPILPAAARPAQAAVAVREKPQQAQAP